MKYWTILVFLINGIANAQFAGGRVTGMGGFAAAIEDPWNIQFNPAGINNPSTFLFSIGHRQSLFSKEISTQSAILLKTFHKDSFGISLQKYGNNEYSEITGILAYAKKFGKLSIGASFNYGQIAIINYGKTTAIHFSLGFIYALNENLAFGIGCINPTNQQYNLSLQTDLNAAFYGGIAYSPASKVIVSSNLVSTNGNLNVVVGIDYEILQKLSIRGGINTFPFKQYSGIGYKGNHIAINMAISRDPNIGYIPQIDIGYAF